jgi:hypothetical protein
MADAFSSQGDALRKVVDEHVNNLHVLIGNEKVNSGMRSEMVNTLSNTVSAFNELWKENIKLCTILEERGKADKNIVPISVDSVRAVIKEEINEVKTSGPLFSDVMKSAEPSAGVIKAPGGKRYAPSKDIAVIITPIDGEGTFKTADDTKARVMKDLDPKKLGIKIKRFSKVGTNSVRIESETSNLLEKVKECEVLTKNNLLEGSHVKCLFRFGKKNAEYSNKVTEIDPMSRLTLRNSGRVFVNFDSYNLDDHLSVTRCYHCQGYGHTAKNCNREEACCGHCSGGHETRDCTKTEESPVCINCVRAKEGHCEHKAGDKKCAQHEKRLERLINGIDYGGQ